MSGFTSCRRDENPLQPCVSRQTAEWDGQMKLLFHLCIAGILGALTCTTGSADQQIAPGQRVDLRDAWHNECFAKWNAGRVFCWSAYN
jgi:hypothetical protein